MEISKPKNRSVSEEKRKPLRLSASGEESKPDSSNVSMAFINTGRKNVSMEISKPKNRSVSERNRKPNNSRESH